jgi:hypothetical protein
MRIESRLMKIVLALLSFAASLQPAFSSTIIGYANVVLAPGYNLIANPFIVTPNNSLTNVITGCPGGTLAYEWDVGKQSFGAAAYFDTLDGWTTPFDLSPGKGCLVHMNSRWTNVFQGEVPQGSFTNFILGTNKLSLLSSKLLQRGTITSALKLPVADGTDLYFYRTNSQSYSNAYSYFDGFGWFDVNAPSAPAEPVIEVGQAFFIARPGPGTNWLQSLIVPNSALSKAKTTVVDPIAPDIQKMVATGAKVTLTIRNPKAQIYNIEFSTDGSTWNTVASAQAGPTWTGPFPGGTQGYFRLTNP